MPSRYFLLLGLIVLVASCKSKKTSLAGDEPVEISDFIEFFPEKKLPYTIADTSLNRKEKDSMRIGYKVFTQFVPDSILSPIFGKTQAAIYPLARIKGDETYLFIKAVTGTKTAAIIACFDKKDNFIAGMPVLTSESNKRIERTVILDSRYTLTKSTTRKNADNSTSDGKDVYILNKESNNFMLIMTDPLDDKAAELINPIDTLSRKQKFTADYGTGKMNLVSFRDGRRDDRLNFFIHFEKNNGECTGELKGEAIMKSATQAIYRQPGDPCAIQFNFTATSVVVKELGGCGSRRGLRCSFDGVYPRKKEAKPKAVKPKTSAKK